MDATAMKSSRKRKKHYAANSTNNAVKKRIISAKFDDSRDLIKKNKFLKNKRINSKTIANRDIQKSNKFKRSNELKAEKVKKDFKKKMLKTGENTCIDFQPIIQTKNIQKSKKNIKSKKVSDSSMQCSPCMSKKASVSTVKKVSKLKKEKKKLGNLKESINSDSDEDVSDICVSDDNESDEETLREEIQNSSIFKQIKKLMKKAPHLNLGITDSESLEDFSDEDLDNVSELSLSAKSEDEDSAMETDDQSASSVESNVEDSCSKKGSTNKKSNNSAKKEDKNVHPTNQKYNRVESVAESTGFNRTLKGNLLNRNISDQDRKSKMSSNLKNKVQEKLAGAKFRFLNEKLYTETGKKAFKYFQENMEEFDDYHSGYRLQVSKWPINPVNEIIADIQKLKKSLVIADLGCGEAKVAQTFPGRTIHSFDLVPLNKFVKACDISKLPLPNESVDVAVFCLSLMGTNLKDYLCEAFRILKVGGMLKIAEVESRIEDLGHFINYLKSIGFTLEKKNTKHKMFVFLDLKKEKQKCKLGKIQSLSLKPCLYKKR